MNKQTMIALAVAAGLLYLVYRMRTNGQPLFVASENTNENNASPEQDAAYWAIFSGGTPSSAGSTGQGSVTPTMTPFEKISQGVREVFFNGTWKAPNAGEYAYAVPSFSPPGATIPPGPVPPAQPTPQSATESSSPWLPADLALGFPLAANPWFFELSAVDPGSISAFKNGSIDIEQVTAPVSLDMVLRG